MIVCIVVSMATMYLRSRIEVLIFLLPYIEGKTFFLPSTSYHMPTLVKGQSEVSQVFKFQEIP